MAESSFGHGHWDYVGSFHHLRIPQNIHLYAANLRNGNSAKGKVFYALRNPQSINTPANVRGCGKHKVGKCMSVTEAN